VSHLLVQVWGISVLGAARIQSRQSDTCGLRTTLLSFVLVEHIVSVQTLARTASPTQHGFG